MKSSRRGLKLLAAVATALFCALAAAVETNRVDSFDESVRTEVHRFASSQLTELAEKVTWLGTLGVSVLFAAGTVATLIYSRRGERAMLLSATMAGAILLENGLKFSFQRVRPLGFYGPDPTTYSFPSGHALFSLCFYGMLALVVGRIIKSEAMKIGVWTVASLLVLAIGWSRIYLGVHYPSDVLGGYLVATAWVAALLSAWPRPPSPSSRSRAAS
jgi:undecaprenyl-diphosphatase